jgi:RNA polymerase sigma-70 factor, ECF subfamily
VTSTSEKPATETRRAGDERFEVTASVRTQVDPEPQALEFNDVYDRHFGFVWRCLRALGVPPAQLDDAAQEVFLAVHRGLAGFRGEAALRTWLYGIVHNVAFKQRRTVARKGRAEPLLAEPIGVGPGPEEHAQDAQAAEFVARFAAGLDDKRRAVFVLALVEGLPIPEVAEIVGVPLNTAYTRLRSVRAELREALQRHGGHT